MDGTVGDRGCAAAQQNIDWLNTTSVQLQEAAAKATASAAAYEAAFSATIPPPVVYANRAQLAALVATNILGQNTPAIAANEAMYGEFGRKTPPRCLPTPSTRQRPRRPRR